MQGTPIPGYTANQTTSSAPVFRVVLKNLTLCESLTNLIQPNILLDHLLMTVLGDANVFRSRLSVYPVPETRQFTRT